MCLSFQRRCGETWNGEHVTAHDLVSELDLSS